MPRARRFLGPRLSALGMGALFALGSSRAEAFSTRVHILIANEVRQALILNGGDTVPLHLSGYSVQLSADDVKALTEQPLAFRAGAIGPDNMVFPGMTDPSHAVGARPYEQCQKLYEAAVTDEERAYAMGCFLHGATDALAHHYVNYMSGETFTLTPITSARQSSWTNVVRHILAEDMLQEKAFEQRPDAFSSGQLAHAIPKGFVLRAYLDTTSPVWQMAAAHSKKKYDEAVAKDPSASLPTILAKADMAPADHLAMTPVYVKRLQDSREGIKADLEAKIAAMQDWSTTDGSKLQLLPGPDGVLGTSDDDALCSASCPLTYATYFTYVGLLEPRHDAKGDPLPSAFDKISDKLGEDIAGFLPAYVQTVENLSALLNAPIDPSKSGLGIGKAEVTQAFAPMLGWADALTTIDYEALVHAVVPDWIIKIQDAMNAVGVNIQISGLVKAIFDPVIQPIKEAIKQYAIDAAQQYLDELIDALETEKAGIESEYVTRLEAAKGPGLTGQPFDHFFDTGLFAHAFNIAAATIANHQVVLPEGNDPVGKGPASFDASHTPAWTQAVLCPYLTPAIFPLGYTVKGSLSVKSDKLYESTVTDDSPVECHDGSLTAFTTKPGPSSCGLVEVAELIDDPSHRGTVSRAYPPSSVGEAVGCRDIVVPGLPGPPTQPMGGSGGSVSSGGSGGNPQAGQTAAGGAPSAGAPGAGGASGGAAGKGGSAGAGQGGSQAGAGKGGGGQGAGQGAGQGGSLSGGSGGQASPGGSGGGTSAAGGGVGSGGKQPSAQAGSAGSGGQVFGTFAQPSSDGGCGCQTAGAPGGTTALGATAAALALAASRRKRKGKAGLLAALLGGLLTLSGCGDGTEEKLVYVPVTGSGGEAGASGASAAGASGKAGSGGNQAGGQAGAGKGGASAGGSSGNQQGGAGQGGSSQGGQSQAGSSGAGGSSQAGQGGSGVGGASGMGQAGSTTAGGAAGAQGGSGGAAGSGAGGSGAAGASGASGGAGGMGGSPSMACCIEKTTPGCTESPTIEACVCAMDAYCCKTKWDPQCISEIATFGCGTACTGSGGAGGAGGMGGSGGSGGGVSAKAKLLMALGDSQWHATQARYDSKGALKTRAYQVEFRAGSLQWAEIRNPYGPARSRQLRSFTVDTDGATVHTTVISPAGWPVSPENGKQATWTLEVVDGSPRKLRVTGDDGLEEFTEGVWPAPKDGLTAYARSFPTGTVSDAFCTSGFNGFDYQAIFEFARGKSATAPIDTDVVAGAKLTTWHDGTGNNQFAITDVDGFDKLGGTEMSDQYNFFVVYTGKVKHPGGTLSVREQNDVVEDGLWVFLGDKVGSSNTNDLSLEVQGFAWPDKTADASSDYFSAGDVAIEAILVRCAKQISDVDVEISLDGGSYTLVGNAPTTPEINDTLFPPALF